VKKARSQTTHVKSSGREEEENGVKERPLKPGDYGLTEALEKYSRSEWHTKAFPDGENVRMKIKIGVNCAREKARALITRSNFVAFLSLEGREVCVADNE